MKFLGATLDIKLNYNTHIDNVTQKVTADLMQCKRAMGQMWGLSALTQIMQMDIQKSGHIHTVNGVCELKLYDKREYFPFNIVQYVHFSSNVPRCILYGIFGTQVIRYFRINNLFENFKLRVLNLVEHCIELGYNFKLLNNHNNVLSRYSHVSFLLCIQCDNLGQSIRQQAQPQKT